MSIDQTMHNLEIFGIPITVFDSYKHAEKSIIQRIKQSKKTLCFAITPRKIYMSQTDKELETILKSTNICICDGVGAALSVRIFHKKNICRITGVQLFFRLIACAEKDGLKVFLLGATHHSLEEARMNLLKMYPHLKIVGHQNGYFSDDELVIDRINRSQPDMLFIAMGSPYQEKWIYKFRDKMNIPFCMGVGGTFDVVSGHAIWAPKIFRKTGTEFLYRLICNPKRFNRQLILLRFVFLVIHTKIKLILKKRNQVI